MQRLRDLWRSLLFDDVLNPPRRRFRRRLHATPPFSAAICLACCDVTSHRWRKRGGEDGLALPGPEPREDLRTLVEPVGMVQAGGGGQGQGE